MDKLSDDVEKLSNGNDEIVENVTKEIRKVHKEMEEGGFINKTDLYHPQKTKKEFFWLLAFHAIFSSIALILGKTGAVTFSRLTLRSLTFSSLTFIS